jgi:pimeloyl-ACP methyl ester carboxylesterase
MNAWTRRSFIAAGIGLAGCSRLERPSLPWLYRPTQDRVDQPPLIVIPGTFGSSLRDTRSGEEIWPRSNSRLLVSKYGSLELDIDPVTLEPVTHGVEAFDIFEEGLGQDFYGQVLQMLRRAGGYVRCGPCEEPRPGRRNFYVYPFDFRLDSVAAARGLHELIERIRKHCGNPRQVVDILAHSNGGLIARYYARYGTAVLPESGSFSPTYAGAPAIRRLLQVGTPNLGTIQAALTLLRGEEVGLRNIPPEVMATCSAPPQIMPHPSVPWLVDLSGNVLSCDLYDISTWSERGWGPFEPRIAERTVEQHGGGASGRRYLGLLREYMAKQLHFGRRFAEALSVPSSPQDVQPYVFGGDCEPTLARLVAESVDGQFHARESIADIARPTAGADYRSIMFEPGDTVVTRSSLLGRRSLNIAAPRDETESMRVAHSVFLCERHHSLMANPSFQDNLLNALLSDDPV